MQVSVKNISLSHQYDLAEIEVVCRHIDSPETGLLAAFFRLDRALIGKKSECKGACPRAFDNHEFLKRGRLVIRRESVDKLLYSGIKPFKNRDIQQNAFEKLYDLFSENIGGYDTDDK